MPYKDPEQQKAWYQKNRDRVLAASTAYYAENREEVRTRHARWQQANPESGRVRTARWRAAHPERSVASVAAWRMVNPEKKKAAEYAWYVANPGKVLAKVARRRAARLQAVPVWANQQKIAAIYAEAAAKGMHVDHVVPLQSKLVCGLHVEHNLQLLPGSENCSKSNRYWPEMP